MALSFGSDFSHSSVIRVTELEGTESRILGKPIWQEPELFYKSHCYYLFGYIHVPHSIAISIQNLSPCPQIHFQTPTLNKCILKVIWST